MSYIIHGATGAQGSPLLKLLKQSGKSVIAAVHQNTQLEEGTLSVNINYDDVDSLVAAYQDADGIFVHLPQTLEQKKLDYAKNIAKAIGQADPKRVVISTSGAIIDDPQSPLQTPKESAIAVLIDEIQKTGVSFAIIAPRLYLENLLLPVVYNGVVDQGVLNYPLPANLPVSWASHLDIAKVAARLLADPSITGVVGVGQLPGLEGQALAEGFSAHLNKPVKFQSINPTSFQGLIGPIIGENAAIAVAGLYQVLQQVPEHTIKEETSAQKLLGIEPLPIQEWLKTVLA